MYEKIIIAIDGPAGSGKSTVAKRIAYKLGFLYLDTGAMYRAITYAAIRNNILNNIDAIIDIVQDIDLKFNFENGVTRVYINGEEVTDLIRSVEVNSKVSEVSVIPEVRKELVKIQRQIASDNSLVAEGRDISTVVFPQADVKIYLTATLEERAKRRYMEFAEQGKEVSLEAVKENIAKRDKIDSGRDLSPLKKADDAYEVDTTDISIDEEVNLILEKVEEVKRKQKFEN